MISDEHFYGQAGQELVTGQIVTAIMAKAYSDALGDKEKAAALYIKYRVRQLSDEYEVRERKRQEGLKRKEQSALEEKRWRQAKENVERNKMWEEGVTECKNCGYWGKMKPSYSLIPQNDHKVFAKVVKCPKCNHRFDWYYKISPK